LISQNPTAGLVAAMRLAAVKQPYKLGRSNGAAMSRQAAP
jgi:hypothetical protein